MKRKKIICIGDSHASFFSGQDIIQPEYPVKSINVIPHLEGVRLGAVLAYNLHKNNTTSRGREKLFEFVSTIKVDETIIMLCFGEIDCRFHLLKIAEKTNRDIKQVVYNAVSKYFNVIMEIKNLGFEVIIWNVIPSSDFNDNELYPSFGTQLQRNICTQHFNLILKQKCIEKDIQFVDIFNKLVTKKLKTKNYFFFDGIHLGQLAMPIFIKKISEFYPTLLKKKNLETSFWINLQVAILRSKLKSLINS